MAHEDGQIHVSVRVRPLNSKEEAEGTAWQMHEKSMVEAKGNGSFKEYRFDRVFAPDVGQAAVYEHCARPAVTSLFDGFNSTVMAYGQTGAGKTFSMSGGGGAERGIVRLAADEIVSQARLLATERARHGQRLTVRMLRRLEHEG